MGDAALSVLVKDVSERLTSGSIQELGLLWGVKDDILTLKHDFDKIEAVVHDAEEKRSRAGDVDPWLKSLRSASLMVENVLDEISTEAMLQSLYKKRGTKYRVRAFFTPHHNQLTLRVRVPHTVKDIRRKVDAIASKIFELKLTPVDATSHVDVDVMREMLDIGTSLVIGRERNIEMVIEMICNKDIGKNENGEIRVCCIWGFGGTGKTTLARIVFNNERLNYFEFKYWVCVSDSFQVKEIIKQLIESIDKCECTLTHLDVLQEVLQNKLKGKKFLLVLDDVWDVESAKPKWDLLIKTLSYGAEESIVMMTTRFSTVSQMMAKVPELQLELKGLSEEDARLVFEKYAAKERKGSWTRAKKHKLALEEAMMLDALEFSYNKLLPHLKQCFAYCYLFPKDYAMEKNVVIQLWVVNGFIPPETDKDLYALGEETFNYLVSKSFFQVVNGKKYMIDRFKIHYLLNDMEQEVMGDDCFVVKKGVEKVIIPNEALHLSLSCPDIQFLPKDLEKSTSLKSIFMFEEGFEYSIKQNFNHVYLRVLYLCGIGLRTLPESICKLKHLKELNLSNSRIEVLPESIVYLQNLQALLLHRCRYVRKLPEGLRYLGKLQCLDIRGCDSLLHLPFGIKELTCLQRLPLFPVGKKSGARIGELRDLNLLEGKLHISRLENVGGLSEAKSANLKCKADLSVLELRWSNISKGESRAEMFVYDQKVLEGLEPNKCLKGLQIFYYMGNVISPSWMANLRNLAQIEFFHCKKCEYIPSLGRLPNLRVIGLWGMDSLKSIHDNDTNMFLCLEVLNISYCPRLVSLPSNFPKLKVLDLKHCMELVSLPDEIQSFTDLNELYIYNCKHLSERYEKELGVDWPKISHIPNIGIVLPRRMR